MHVTLGLPADQKLSPNCGGTVTQLRPKETGLFAIISILDGPSTYGFDPPHNARHFPVCISQFDNERRHPPNSAAPTVGLITAANTSEITNQ